MSETKKSFSEFYDMKVKDIMQESPETSPCIEEQTPSQQIFSLLLTNDCLWVVESKDPRRLIGVITESDTLPLLSPPITSLQTFDKPDARSLQYGEDLTAHEIMSKNPVTATLDETLRDVLIKMKTHKLKKLPVVNQDGVFLGDISLHQFIETYCKEIA